jgi:hypothetical protein
MEPADLGMLLLRIAAGVAGLLLVLYAVLAAIKTFILPRPAQVWVIRQLFLGMRLLFDLRANRADSYAKRDAVMALYAPITLFLVPVVLMSLVLIGYTLIFWAVGGLPLFNAFRSSGSSLLTLGNYANERPILKVLEFSEAMLGLILVALLIAYLPTMYSAFTKRETQIGLLEVRAGIPPSAVEMVSRSFRTGEMLQLREIWDQWHVWFAEIEESHTSLPALAFFRSARPEMSWVTAAGTVLDTAALMLSTIDVPWEPRAAYCIRSGFLALRQIARFFEVPFAPDPSPTDRISIGREEFDALCDQLAAQGVPLKPDRDQAWRDFAGWRVNYDTVLIALADLTMAPYAQWSSDRSLAPTARPVAPGRVRTY